MRKKMSNQRESQFSGFASSLAEEIRKRIEQLYAEFGLEPPGLVNLNIHVLEPLLTRRVYDLACYVVQHNVHANGDMSKIPDMAALPEEQAQ